MRDLKYIIVFYKYPAMARAIIFNGEITHKTVIPEGWTCVAGGFCALSGEKFGDLKAVCWGESTSIGVKSRPEDAEIVAKTINRTFCFNCCLKDMKVISLHY